MKRISTSFDVMFRDDIVKRLRGVAIAMGPLGDRDVKMLGAIAETFGVGLEEVLSAPAPALESGPRVICAACGEEIPGHRRGGDQ